MFKRTTKLKKFIGKYILFCFCLIRNRHTFQVTWEFSRKKKGGLRCLKISECNFCGFLEKKHDHALGLSEIERRRRVWKERRKVLIEKSKEREEYALYLRMSDGDCFEILTNRFNMTRTELKEIIKQLDKTCMERNLNREKMHFVPVKKFEEELGYKFLELETDTDV